MPRPGKFGKRAGITNDETSAKTMKAAATAARPISWLVESAASVGAKENIAVATLPSDHEGAVVVVDGLPGHAQRVVGEQPRHRAGDLLRLAHATERHLAHRLGERLLARHAGKRVQPLPGHVRVDPARTDGV